MAEVKNMTKSAIAVITLAAIVLIGLAVIGGFESALRESTTADDVIVVAALGLVNVSADITSTYPWAQSITGCVTEDDGEEILEANYTFIQGNFARGGVGTVTLNDGGVDFEGDGLNCTITNLADTDASDAAELFQTGMIVFATFMAVLVLAIIGMIIIKLFKSGKD